MLAERMRLLAVRQGAALAEIRASRQPRWYNCETALTDALETPLAAGETRLIIGGDAIPLLRLAALGTGALCTQQGTPQLPALLCTDGRPLPGEPVSTAALPEPSLPAALSGGWKLGADGLPWSEGPRATLLFREGTRRVRLTLDGIARKAGDTREITLRVQDAAPRLVTLQDLRPTEIELDIPHRAAPVRIAIDIFRPIPPGPRGLPEAPVQRAGVRLRSLVAE